MTHFSAGTRGQALSLKRTGGFLFAAVLVAALPSLSAIAAPDRGLPSQVLSAKLIYLDNQTGDDGLLGVARDEFTKWGRYKVVAARADAELIAVFKHRSGMDKLGNVGITEMDIFLSGATEPSFAVNKGGKTIFDPHGRVKSAVDDFWKRVEDKP